MSQGISALQSHYKEAFDSLGGGLQTNAELLVIGSFVFSLVCDWVLAFAGVGSVA